MAFSTKHIVVGLHIFIYLYLVALRLLFGATAVSRLLSVCVMLGTKLYLPIWNLHL